VRFSLSLSTSQSSFLVSHLFPTTDIIWAAAESVDSLSAPPNGFRSCGIANGSRRWWWFVCCPCEEKQHQPPPPFPMLLSVVVGCCDEVWASGGGVVNRSTSRNPRRIFGRLRNINQKKARLTVAGEMWKLGRFGLPVVAMTQLLGFDVFLFFVAVVGLLI
jgi:hypothetical protein